MSSLHQTGAAASSYPLDHLIDDILILLIPDRRLGVGGDQELVGDSHGSETAGTTTSHSTHYKHRLYVFRKIISVIIIDYSDYCL